MPFGTVKTCPWRVRTSTVTGVPLVAFTASVVPLSAPLIAMEAMLPGVAPGVTTTMPEVVGVAMATPLTTTE